MNCLPSPTRQKKRPSLRRHHSMPLLLSSSRRIKSKARMSRGEEQHHPQDSPPRPNRKAKDDLSLVSNGHCPTCGTKLYRFGKSFWRLSRKKSQFAKPLTIPGKVENGRCLICVELHCDQPLVPPPPPLRRQINILYHAFMDVLSDSIHRPFKPKFVYEGDFNLYGQRHGEGTVRPNSPFCVLAYYDS